MHTLMHKYIKAWDSQIVCMPKYYGVGLSFYMFLNFCKAERYVLGMYAQSNKIQNVDKQKQISILAIDFDFIMVIQKLYKGKYHIRACFNAKKPYGHNANTAI